MPEATCHGVLPWRAPAGQRRRIFSLRFHIQHGELRQYRENKGIFCGQDFPEWQQVCSRMLWNYLLLVGTMLSEIPFKACSDDCCFVLQRHFSPETLELLLGAPESHVKDIARQAAVNLAPFDELYPPLLQSRL